MVLGLTILQHFQLDDHQGFNTMKWTLLVLIICGFIVFAVVGFFDLNKENNNAIMIASLSMSFACGIGLIAFLTTPYSIDKSDLIKTKVENIAEITPLTDSYRLKMSTGHVIHVPIYALNVRDSNSGVNSGQAVIEMRRKGITKYEIASFNKYHPVWPEVLFGYDLIENYATQPKVYLSKPGQRQLAKLKVGQTMKLDY